MCTSIQSCIVQPVLLTSRWQHPSLTNAAPTSYQTLHCCRMLSNQYMLPKCKLPLSTQALGNAVVVGADSSSLSLQGKPQRSGTLYRRNLVDPVATHVNLEFLGCALHPEQADVELADSQRALATSQPETKLTRRSHQLESPAP